MRQDNYEDRRRFPRYDATIPVRLDFPLAGRPPLEAQILNLSLGGAKIYCEEPLIIVGEQLVIHVPFQELKLGAKVTSMAETELQIDEADLETSVVRWVDENEKTFGVEFTGITTDSLVLLEELVEKFRLLTRKK